MRKQHDINADPLLNHNQLPIKKYSKTPLSKFDPLIIFPDKKNSMEIKKK